MAEAQALLDQLMEMMQNMRVTRGEGGQGSAGQQALDGLGETLRDQQDLSDDSFRSLQDQFNPGQQGGQPGQPGQGQPGGERPGAGAGGERSLDPSDLAERQRALRQELERQGQNLPGAGTEEGDAARDSLGRAGRAMDEAEQALRDGDLGRALDEQAQALDALREGLRNLGEAMAQQQRGEGEDGEAMGRDNREVQRDPLGRNIGNAGRIGTDENLLRGEDIRRRAEELLDEIRRRSGEQSRPEEERNYLERLLDRF